MDENKKEKMEEVGFCIRGTCTNCVYGDFSNSKIGNWGLCKKHSYKHKKHNREHQMPAIRFGWCEFFKWAEPIKVVGKYLIFKDKE